MSNMFNKENGALEMRFDAYPQRQFVTESININSLAYHHIWSTIQTLPATLPEPSSMDRGPRPGVTGALSYFRMTLAEGVGPRLGWALCLETRSFNELAKAMQFNFIAELQVQILPPQPSIFAPPRFWPGGVRFLALCLAFAISQAHPIVRSSIPHFLELTVHVRPSDG